MKKIYVPLIAVSLVILTFVSFSFKTESDIRLDAPKWEVDSIHSSISFTVTHFFTPINGAFDKFTGSLSFDPEQLATSSVDFTVEISSINTKNAKRDGHLQSEDFFNAKQWPTMSFKSEKFESTGDNKFMVSGKMTIRDVTKDISIPLELLGVRDHMMKEGSLVGALKSEFSLNRNDYGVGTGDWAATVVIGDEVSISIFFEIIRPK
ncbi:MAG: YceI family protein [Bacteroidetes bacterium]|nr:YceI family protein [Bacteroidota bacterium]